ncbi:MAG TPA: hypothetical protein VFA65_20945, partial [Bryobacteraceae bacterium]|nr:hypothetical protein [Bryobacteraceae bacterium]
DASCSSCGSDKAKTGPTSKIQKTVTAKIITLAFREDHKVLKPSPGDYDDAAAGAAFKKPEWDISKGDPYLAPTPVSYTKATNVQVDIEIDFTVTPPGQTAFLTGVKGTPASGFDYFSFEKTLNQTIGTQRIPVTGLVSKDKLPNFVTFIDRGISWSATIDGTDQDIGSTSHRVYVTFDKPIGKMASTTPNLFTETGPDQDVTEERLAFAVNAAANTGVTDEKECVDAIFVKLCKLNVGYYLGRRWEPGQVNNTGMAPKPTLHHYLWKTMADSQNAKGECHNIAAAFELVCRIVGVSGPFEVGYMLPRPSRAEQPPSYPKVPNALLGMYNTQGQAYWRQHTGESHGWENLYFLDGHHQTNNFEGVARYRNALYALGDAVFDLFNDPQQNASSYFAVRRTDSNYKVINLVPTKGVFELAFNKNQVGGCTKPYPWMNSPQTYKQGLNLPQQWDFTATVFHWHD